MGQSRQQYSAFSSSSVFRLTKLIFRLANYTHIHSELCSLFRRRPRCLPCEIHERYYHCGTSNNVFILTGGTGSYVSNLSSRNGSASNLWRYRASGGWVIGDAHSPTSQCWSRFLYGEAVRSRITLGNGVLVLLFHIPSFRTRDLSLVIYAHHNIPYLLALITNSSWFRGTKLDQRVLSASRSSVILSIRSSHHILPLGSGHCGLCVQRKYVCEL